MIAFTCPGCGRNLAVAEQYAGTSTPCPHCRRPVDVPAPTEAASDYPTRATQPPGPPTLPGDALTPLGPPRGPGELGRLGPYRVLSVLGCGGMGAVYRAEDTHLQRPVALKVMLPAVAADEVARQRFL